MKRFIISLLILLSACISQVLASDVLSIQYKDIKDENKIKFADATWTNNVKRSDKTFFVKIVDNELFPVSTYYKEDGTFAFDTECDYEFIEKGDFIGYSNSDLKFYDLTYKDGIFNKRELLEEEVQELFPEFTIIKISEFSNTTNSIKVKKDSRNFKIILLNDTDRTFNNYSFSTGYSMFKKYSLVGMINVQKKGMIQFSHFGDNTKSNPWFILLVR